MAAGMALVYFALLVAILPVVMPMDSGRDTAAALKRMATPQTEVLTYGVRYPVSIAYYSGLVPKRLVPTEEDIEKARPQKMSWTATNIMPFASIEKMDLSRETIILTDFDNRDKLGEDVPGFWQEVAETDAYCIYQLMPGREYVASIRDFWRVCAGCDAAARARVEKFLHEVLNTDQFPLTVMDRPIESETAKIVENSYRATILAYLHEWSLFAERNGVDLIKVVDAIKMRPTHSNMIFPGPGIGGYCLPKDGGLGYWAYKHILGFEDGDKVFRITPAAVDINDTRALHVAELTRDALRNMDRYIAASQVLIAGASYRQDVGDTRYSGSELVVRKLTEMGAEMRAHDPYVEQWWEFAEQDAYPTSGLSWKRFFRNQDELSNLKVENDLAQALQGVDALILAVPHDAYRQLTPEQVVEWAGKPIAIIDCFGLLDDATIARYFELGCEVKGLGRGHIQRIKQAVRRT